MKLAYAVAAPIALTAAPAMAAVKVKTTEPYTTTGTLTPGFNKVKLPIILPEYKYLFEINFSQEVRAGTAFFSLNRYTSQGSSFQYINGSGMVTSFSFEFPIYFRTQEIELNIRAYGVTDYVLTITPLAPVERAGVPEPMAWMMLILGFGAAGGAMRYRRRMSTSVRYSFT